MRRLAVWAVVGGLGLPAGRVCAAAGARSSFETALRYYDVGNYDRACAGFRQAFALSARASILIDLGVCERRRGNLRGGAALLRLFLSRESGSPLAPIAEKLLVDTDAEARRLEAVVLPDFEGRVAVGTWETRRRADELTVPLRDGGLRDPFATDADRDSTELPSQLQEERTSWAPRPPIHPRLRVMRSRRFVRAPRLHRAI